MIMIEETVICRICLEPIYNFICMDCFASQIEKILPSELKNPFLFFHENLRERFENSENTELCIKCKQIRETAICPYCYLKEVFIWLSERNERVAGKVAKFFNFNFENTEFDESIKVRNWIPVILNQSSEEFDLNICENCGELKELRKVDGRWLCESCVEEI